MNPQSSKKKGNKKMNGFSILLFEHKRNLQKTGREISNCELQEECDILWKAMTPEEREVYHKQANHTKPKAEKYTSQGVPFSTIDNQRLEKQNEKEEMNLDIDRILDQAVEDETLDTTEFFFLRTSHFVQTLRFEIFPAELAICKFSLEEGVIDIVNTLINPGPLPLGMSSTAIAHADKTHQLPLPPNCVKDSKDVEEVYEIIMNFVGHVDNKCPIMFTAPGQAEEEINATKLIMQKIWTAIFGTDIPFGFKVYPLDLFFFKLNEKRIEIQNKLNNTNKKGFASVFSAKDLLDRDLYEYAGIGCDYHEEKDASKHCCQSMVRRWVFTFAKHIFADESNQNLVAGKHFPLSYEGCNENSSKAKKKIIDDPFSDLTPPIMFALQEKYKNKNNAPRQFKNAVDPFEAFNLSLGGAPKENRVFEEISSLCTSYSSISIGRGRSTKNPSEKSGTSSKVVTGRGKPIIWDINLDK